MTSKEEKLSKAQRRMLEKVCASRWGGIQQWEALVEGPRSTLDALIRRGLVTEHFYSLGSHPSVKPTLAGRTALERSGG